MKRKAGGMSRQEEQREDCSKIENSILKQHRISTAKIHQE